MPLNNPVLNAGTNTQNIATSAPSSQTASPTTAQAGKGIPRCRPRSQQTDEPPEPWESRRGTFDVSGNNGSGKKYEKKLEEFSKQATLLDELIQPSKPSMSPVSGTCSTLGKQSELGTYVKELAFFQTKEKQKSAVLEEAKAAGVELEYDAHGSLKYEFYHLVAEANKNVESRDVCVYDLAEDSHPRVCKLNSFSDVPFQGTGCWGLAVLPSRTKKRVAEQMLVKIKVARWLEKADGVEAVAIVRASRLTLKKVKDLEAAGVKLLFDFSGRVDKKRGVFDPLDGMLDTESRYRRFKLLGTLSPKQAEKLGSGLNESTTMELLGTIATVFEARYAEVPAAVVEAITLGREHLDEEQSSASFSAAQRRRTSEPTHWIQSLLTLDSSNLPERDTEQLKGRLTDVSKIWVSTLKQYNLSMTVTRLTDFRTRETTEPDFSMFPYVAKVFSIDKKLDAYYSNVPVEDLLS